MNRRTAVWTQANWSLGKWKRSYYYYYRPREIPAGGYCFARRHAVGLSVPMSVRLCPKTLYTMPGTDSLTLPRIVDFLLITNFSFFKFITIVYFTVR